MSGLPMADHLPESIERLVDCFVTRIDTVAPGVPVHIFHHGDADGLCAAAAAAALIFKARRNVLPTISWVGTHQFDFKPIDDYLRAHSNHFVLCFDLNLSSRPGYLNELAIHTQNTILIIDDHLLSDISPSVRTILFNPNIGGKPAVDFPPSLFAFSAAAKAGVHITEWLPIMGLFVDRQLEHYKEMFAWIPARDEILDAVATLTNIYLLPSVSSKDDYPIDLLVQLGELGQCSWSDFLSAIKRDERLSQSKEIIQQNLDTEFAAMVAAGPVTDHSSAANLFVFQQESSFRYTNLLATRISLKFPDRIVLVFRNDIEFSYFEIRVGKNVRAYDVVWILRQVAASVSLRNFGGHARAAGGSCTKETLGSMVTSYVRNAATRLARE
jgi:single-stranded DNA-specific DHH superfamily exonuclease